MIQPRLLIFAKQPVPGQVKTRLQPDYTPERAADIAAFMIRATVELAVAAWPGEVVLYASPGADHPLFRQLARDFRIALAPQAEGDLGARMLSAFRDGSARGATTAIMGCDVPHCGWDVIDQANHWLARGKDVLGPTEDGGYYLIGLQDPRPELFEEMPWGGHQVLPMTIARSEKLGMDFSLLPTLRDVDTAADLWLVAQKYEPLKKFL